MPRIEISTEHKADKGTDFPKIFLEKDERARIVILDSEIVFEWVHTLRSPKIVDGRAVHIVEDGQTMDKLETNFVGRYVCAGDIVTLTEKALDATSCPICRECKKSGATTPPERRFAGHVVKYQTRPGSFEVSSPYQVSVLAWVFGDNIYNKLADLRETWKDFRKHDLLLGPCTVKQFQKFEISPAPDAAWLTNDDTIKHTAEVYKNNRCEDLTALLGRTPENKYLQDDLQRCITNHRLAYGPSSSEGAQQGLDVDSILGAPFDEGGANDLAAQEAMNSAAASSIDLDSILGDLTDGPPPPQNQTADVGQPEPTVEEVQADEEVEAPDLDSLLS